MDNNKYELSVNNYLISDAADKPFSSENPYNETDALVFSTLAYLPMDGVLNGEGESITIQKLADKIFDTREYKKFYINTSETPAAAENYESFIKALSQSDRYKNLSLSDFRNEYVALTNENFGKEKQFAAVTIKLPDGSPVVAFRGTNGTMAGWKEDFNLAFSSEIPAQCDSREYLTMIANKYKDENIYVTGHSKGGHLAIYSSLTCDKSIQDRIASILNFDGPGVRNDIMFQYSDAYENIKDKIIGYVPPSSMIGMLLVDHKNQSCVASTETGIMQHDHFSWQISESGELIKDSRGRDTLSRFVNDTLDDALECLSPKELEVLVDTVFMLGNQNGKERFTDIFDSYKQYFNTGNKEDIVKGIAKTLNDINNLNVEQKEVLIRTVSVMTFAAVDNAFDIVRDGVDKWTEAMQKRIKQNADDFVKFAAWIGLHPAEVRLAETLSKLYIKAVSEVVKSFLNYWEEKLLGVSNKRAEYGELRVNLSHLEVLVDRLNGINRRIMSLDNDLNYLRDSVEWYEIFDSVNIAEIDFLLIGYDHDLKKCIDYMNLTIGKLNACENRVHQNANSFR